MKKTLVLLAVLILGCESASNERYNYLLRHAEKFVLANQQKREKLVSAFKEAYPENWEEKLLEYDLQQESLQKQQQALSQQQEFLRQYQTRQGWQNFWQEFSNVYQRQLDRNAYGYQPVIITQRNSTHWQEANAHDELMKRNQYKSPLDSLSNKYRYDP